MLELFENSPKPGLAIKLNDLITLFNKTFSSSFNTCLLSGGDEPEYLPADKHWNQNRIIFRKDYLSSALHEIAHWCIAGVERRRQRDYGYWYAPDGRNSFQQDLFQKVEAKPQALEWIFSQACGVQFNVSVDNLNGSNGEMDSTLLVFKRRVVEQARQYCHRGLNPRASQWVLALQTHLDTVSPFDVSWYSMDRLNNK